MDAPVLGALIAGYLLGSIPIGPWLGRLAGIDVRRHGSGNTGATNVARSVGKIAGVATLVGDALKGAVAVLVAQFWVPDSGIAGVAGLAAIVGHSFSIFLGFGGGKGVATALGVFLTLAPAATVVSVVVFTVVALTTRTASLASLAAAASLPVATYLGHYPGFVWGAAAAAAFLIMIRHRDNLRRLADGTEPTFRSKR